MVAQEAVKLMFEWAELVGRRLAKQTDKHRIRFFIASDSSTVIEMAQVRFGRENVLVTPGEPQVRDTSRSPPRPPSLSFCCVCFFGGGTPSPSPFRHPTRCSPTDAGGVHIGNGVTDNVNRGTPQDTRVVDTAASRLKAAADWWLLGQSDGLVLGRDSSYADKAVLAAMHVPVLVRCSNAYSKEDVAQQAGLNAAVEGWACRPSQVMDEIQGPRAV